MAGFFVCRSWLGVEEGGLTTIAFNAEQALAEI